ncbi:MAG TPA: hypothetical protein GXX37_01360 [Clostridiaceae bacterium]|nr:hypothetical protein [Clostridiaceae bacterium]
MLELFINKIASNNSREVKIICLYRYLSWFFTSMFYLFNSKAQYPIFKIGVIIILFITSKIVTNLYAKYSTNTKAIKSLVLTETVGISLLLIPTGGLDSPFIWYAMNPVLISASFLTELFCWFNLAFYLAVSTSISYFIFNTENNTATEILSANSHLILIFILITLGLQLVLKLAHELNNERNHLKEINYQLTEANEKIKESMEHIMSLYQAVEMFSAQDSKEKLMNTVIYYAKELTKSKSSFFKQVNLDNSNKIITYGDISPDMDSLIEKELSSALKMNEMDEIDKNITYIRIQNRIFAISIVKSASRLFGILGIEVEEFQKNDYLYKKLLSFLTELSAVILERLYLEEITQKLVVAEEQNRIANEMHDSVCQRLFSISYAIHTLVAKYSKLSDMELRDQLIRIMENSNMAMKELRSTIYKLSSKKQGRRIFVSDIKDYLDSVARLNNVDVSFKCSGDEDLLTGAMKKAIYRIIAESTGNSIRHGKCSEVHVELNIKNTCTELIIKDNGKGFIIEDTINKRNGLGISNIKRLVNSFNGSISIDSVLGEGTCIKINIPGGNLATLDEGGLVV